MSTPIRRNPSLPTPANVTPPAVPSTRTQMDGPETFTPATPDTFSAGIDPRPLPAAAHRTDLASTQRWNSVDLGGSVGTGGPGQPAVAEAGKPWVVNYSRGASDLGEQGELKRVEMQWKLNNGDVQTAVVMDGTRDMRTGAQNRFPIKVNLPEDTRGQIQYWFKLETTDGRTLWDSDFGRNHRVDVLGKGGSVVRFDDLWGESVSGPLKAGGTLRLAYDTDRLKQFLRGTRHHGYETWNVTAFVSFDGRPPQELPITTVRRGQYGESNETVTHEAALPIPADARNVSVWFRGSAYGGSVFGGNAWDSNESANYSWPIEPG